MGHRHNPLDPRDPRSLAFYYLLVEGGDGRGSGPAGGGCGCLLGLMLFVFAIGLIAWH